MNAIADKMEQKHHYRQRGVPNPYRASAFGIASGRMKSTEDIIRLGGVMGAMGAFDDDAQFPASSAYEPWEFDDIGASDIKVNKNRYAWRLNCEDGNEYGINPEDYETREEYTAALNDAKAGHTTEADEFLDSDAACASAATETETDDMKEYIFCRVSRLDNGSNEYYLSATSEVRIGSIVSVPTQSGVVSAVVLSVERHTRLTAPQPPENSEFLISS